MKTPMLLSSNVMLWDIVKIFSCFCTIWAFWIHVAENLASWGKMVKEFQSNSPNSESMFLFQKKMRPRTSETSVGHKKPERSMKLWPWRDVYYKTVRTQDPINFFSTEQRFFPLFSGGEREGSCLFLLYTRRESIFLFFSSMECPATYVGDFSIWPSSYHLRGKDWGEGEITHLLIVRQ